MKIELMLGVGAGTTLPVGMIPQQTDEKRRLVVINQTRAALALMSQTLVIIELELDDNEVDRAAGDALAEATRKLMDKKDAGVPNTRFDGKISLN